MPIMHRCTCGDDGNAFMWATDGSSGGGGEEEVSPVFAFERHRHLLRRLAWGTHPDCADWVAVSVDNTLEVVHV
jgi:hypothetical protein